MSDRKFIEDRAELKKGKVAELRVRIEMKNVR